MLTMCEWILQKCVCVLGRNIRHGVCILRCMEGVSVRVCDIMGPTNVAYYIDEISWEMNLLVPLINTQRIVITLLFSFCAPSLFFFLSKPCSVLLFRVHQYTHTQKCHLRHTQHNGKLQAFMQRVKDVYEKKYQQIMINNCSFYLNLWKILWLIALNETARAGRTKRNVSLQSYLFCL